MKDDKSSWAIGGTTMIGIGVGFIFLETSPLIFVACLMIGVGVGLVLAPILSKSPIDKNVACSGYASLLSGYEFEVDGLELIY